MDIVDWRAQIDVIDAELIALLNRRADCSRKIGEWKRRNGQDIVDAERESALLQQLMNMNSGPLSEAHIHSIFSAILDVSRELQERR